MRLLFAISIVLLISAIFWEVKQFQVMKSMPSKAFVMRLHHCSTAYLLQHDCKSYSGGMRERLIAVLIYKYTSRKSSECPMMWTSVCVCVCECVFAHHGWFTSAVACDAQFIFIYTEPETSIVSPPESMKLYKHTNIPERRYSNRDFPVICKANLL